MAGGSAELRETDAPEATERAGAELAATLRPGEVVLVSGDLGAGKTTLVRGALRAGDCEVREPHRGEGMPARLHRVIPLGAVARVEVDVDGHVVQAAAPLPLPAWLSSRAAGDEVALVIRPEAARPLPPPSARTPAPPALGSATDGRRQS